MKSKSGLAVQIENVSKSFIIPHQRIRSMRSAFVNIFRKKSFETFKALDGVSLEINEGEFFGIIGRNGSGKSTLLKIMASIYPPDSGQIWVASGVSPFLELGIGFNPELSGRDNIYLNATILGMRKKQIDKKFDEIVAFSEVERFVDQKLANYSSGMSVRLAFSVAVHANRDILLMDEVLAVGDIGFQKKCFEVFEDLKKKGKTIILVSHDLKQVEKHCQRVALIDKGKLLFCGAPGLAISKIKEIVK
jgi:ABC-2 type transport system ATP-binding protein